MRIALSIAVLGLALPVLAQTPLKSSLEVSGPQVALGALAEGELSARTAQLVLAAAPQPGTEQVWSRAQLQSRLRSLELDPADFTIPERISVTRQARRIDAAAVAAAASAYLKREVRPDQLQFTPPYTTAAAPRITVIDARADRARGALDLLCKDAGDSKLLPFTVAVAGVAAPASIPAAPLAARLKEAAFLVTPGTMATMVLNNPNLDLTLQVKPLGAGRAGDRIRVWSAATHATLTVEVVGKNQVRATSAGGLHEVSR